MTCGRIPHVDDRPCIVAVVHGEWPSRTQDSCQPHHLGSSCSSEFQHIDEPVAGCADIFNHVSVKVTIAPMPRCHSSGNQPRERGESLPLRSKVVQERRVTLGELPDNRAKLARECAVRRRMCRATAYRCARSSLARRCGVHDKRCRA